MELEKIQRSLEGGMSILVGSSDNGNLPTCCRGIAIRASADLTTLTVFVPVATSRDVIANVAMTRRAAVVSSHPTSHVSIQFKGIAKGVRLAPDEDAGFLRERLESWADSIAVVGLPRRITRRIAHWPAFAIDISIDEIYEQTPGPKAGASIR